MAKGNWRNWGERGGAEAHASNRKTIDGWVMKPFCISNVKLLAESEAKRMSDLGYITRVLETRQGTWKAYRTLRIGQTRMEDI